MYIQENQKYNVIYNCASIKFFIIKIIYIMETIKLIFTDTMYIFLTCINSIISFVLDSSKHLLDSSKHLLNKPELNLIIKPKTVNNNLSDIERQNIANIRLAKFNQLTGINRVIQEKNKKKSLFESKYLEIQKDRHNQQLIRDWIN
ncbi:hypothetical protein [Acanthamoeba polyphaga mimivirus]|uniref:Uncharacterized protein n=5 Tax=Megamimivirinae TaxID=3044648 RepID=A0A2L2DMY1_MIMIV|nr:hypothetical protein [Acanthamoeba polyphaga mimivirus]